MFVGVYLFVKQIWEKPKIDPEEPEECEESKTNDNRTKLWKRKTKEMKQKWLCILWDIDRHICRDIHHLCLEIMFEVDNPYDKR